MESTESKSAEIKNDEVNGKTLNSNSVIGRENAFSGEFRSDGLLRIDGDFIGVIKGYGIVLVGERGRIIGDIYARMVRIGGKIKGNIYALERVDILSTGKLIGELWTKKCLAEEGMVFSGTSKIDTKNEIDIVFENNVKKTSPLITEEF
jgi:cytoskeletal protein CcmA (bactofilin family)